MTPPGKPLSAAKISGRTTGLLVDRQVAIYICLYFSVTLMFGGISLVHDSGDKSARRAVAVNSVATAWSIFGVFVT